MNDVKAVSIRLDVKLPSYVAFAVVLVFSFFLAFYTIKAAGNIVDDAKDSPGFNVQKRMETQLSK
jgi:hypothetical protein